MKKLFLSMICVGCTLLVQGQAIFADKSQAWMVGAAHAISSGMVTRFELSSSGTKVIYSKVNPDILFQLEGPQPMSVKWFVYDIVRHINIEVKIPVASPNCELFLLGDERHVFVLDPADVACQGIYDLSTGRFLKLAYQPDHFFYLGESPLAPFLVVEVSDELIDIIWPGQPTQRVKLGRRLGMQEPYYADQRVIRFAGYSRETTPIQFLDIALNRNTGEVSAKEVTRDAWEKLGSDRPDPKFIIYDVGESAKIEPRLSSEVATKEPKRVDGIVKSPPLLESSAYVCPGSYSPRVNRQGSHVVYNDSGALLVREIRPFDFKLAEDMKRAALRAQALSAAKQVGTALMIYAADADDVLPNGENFVGRVSPYLKNDKMLRQFNYTFPGGPLVKVEKPAETELGFVLGPGGRAIVYCDGHAKWIPDKP